MTQEPTNALSYLGKQVTVEIDRPFGSKHPEWQYVYPVNYGFVPGTKAADGEELDVYVLGVSEAINAFHGDCIAVIHRLNDDDDKLIVVPIGQTVDDDKIRNLIEFQEKYFEFIIIR